MSLLTLLNCIREKPKLTVLLCLAISTPDFIDSLFNLLTYFHTNAFVGNMIIAAGVVPILVDFVHNKRPDRLLVSDFFFSFFFFGIDY